MSSEKYSFFGKNKKYPEDKSIQQHVEFEAIGLSDELNNLS